MDPWIPPLLAEFRDSLLHRLLWGQITYPAAVQEIERYLQGANPLKVQAVWQAFEDGVRTNKDARGWRCRALMEMAPAFQSRARTPQGALRMPGIKLEDLSPLDYARAIIWGWTTPHGASHRVSADGVARAIEQEIQTSYPGLPFKAALTEMVSCGDSIRQNVARFILKECKLPDAPEDDGTLAISKEVLAKKIGPGMDEFIWAGKDTPGTDKQVAYLRRLAADQCRPRSTLTFDAAATMWARVLATKPEDLAALDGEFQHLPVMDQFAAGPTYCHNWIRLSHRHEGWIDPRGFEGVKEKYVHEGVEYWITSRVRSMDVEHGLEGKNLGAVIHHLQCIDPSDSVNARLVKMMTIAETVAGLLKGWKATLRNPTNIVSCEAWRMWELWLELFSQPELAPLASKVEALSLLRPWMDVHAPDYLDQWEAANGIPMSGHLDPNQTWFEPKQGRTEPSVPNVTQNSLATLVAEGKITLLQALMDQKQAEADGVWINYRNFGQRPNTSQWENPVWAEAYCRLLPPDFHVDFKDKAIPGFEKWRAGRNQRAARGRYQAGQLPTLAYWVITGLLRVDEARQIYRSGSPIPAAMTHGWTDATEVYLAQGVFTGEAATRFVHAWIDIERTEGVPYTGKGVILEQWVKPADVARVLKERAATQPAQAGVDKESLNWWPGVLRTYAGNVATGSFTPSMARALWRSYLRGEGPGISNGSFHASSTTLSRDTHQAFGYVTDRAIEGMNLNMRHGVISQAAGWVHDVLREEANPGPFTTLSPNALKTLKILCLQSMTLDIAAEVLAAAIEWGAVVSYEAEVTARDGATSDDVEGYWTSILSHPAVTRLTGGNLYEEQRLAWREKNYVYHIPARAYKNLKEEVELESIRRGMKSLGDRSPRTVHSLATALEVVAYDFNLDRAKADVTRGHVGDGTLRTFRDGIVPQGAEFTSKVVRVWCELQEKVTLQSLALLLPWIPIQAVVNGVASWNGEVADAKKDWLTRDLVKAFGPWENFLDSLARMVAGGQMSAAAADRGWASYVRATTVAHENGKVEPEVPQSYAGAKLDPIEILAARTSILSRSRELLNTNAVGMMTVAGALTLQECRHNVDGMVARTNPNIEVDSKVLTPLMGKDTIAKDGVTAPAMESTILNPSTMVSHGVNLEGDEAILLNLCLDVQEGYLSQVDAACWWLSDKRAEYKHAHFASTLVGPRCQETWWKLCDLSSPALNSRNKLSHLPGVKGMGVIGALDEKHHRLLGYLAWEMSQGHIDLAAAVGLWSVGTTVTKNFVLPMDQFGSHQVHCWLRILGATRGGFEGIPPVDQEVLLAGMLAYQAELRMRAAHAIVPGGQHHRDTRRRAVIAKLDRDIALPEAPEYTDDIGVIWEYLNLCEREGGVTFEDLYELYPWTSPGSIYEALRRALATDMKMDDDLKTAMTWSVDKANVEAVTRHAELVNPSRKPWVGGRILNADEANTLWNLAAGMTEKGNTWTLEAARTRFVNVLLGIGEPYNVQHGVPERGAMERAWADIFNSDVIRGHLGRYDYHTLMEVFYARKGRPMKRSAPGAEDKEDVVALALLVAQGRLTPDRALDLWNSPDAVVTWMKTSTTFQASVSQNSTAIARDMDRKMELKGADFGMKFVRIWNWLTDCNTKGETWNVDRDLADYVDPDVLVQCTNDESDHLDVFSMALAKSVLGSMSFQEAKRLWNDRFNLEDKWMVDFVRILEIQDSDNDDLMREMLLIASCLPNPTSFLNIGAFSNEATIEGLRRYVSSLDEVSAAEDTVMAEVARWVPNSVAEALMKLPTGDWRVGHFRGLPGVGDHMQAAKEKYVPLISADPMDDPSYMVPKRDLRDELSPSMQMTLSLAFLCSIGTVTVTEAAQDLAAYIRHGAIFKGPETLDLNRIPTDSSLRETVANILAHPLMTSLDAVGTYLPQPRLHEFDMYQARLAERVMKSSPYPYQAAPTKGEIAIETIKSDAREIALRTGVRRVRAAIAEKFSAWWSRQNQPRAAGETADAYHLRLEAGRTQAQAFLGTDMGEASLAMLAGFVWTVVGEDVSNEQVRSFGDAVAREMRVSAGTDILDAVVTEVLRPTMAEIQAILPSTGIRVQAATVEADDDQDLRAGEARTRRA